MHLRELFLKLEARECGSIIFPFAGQVCIPMGGRYWRIRPTHGGNNSLKAGTTAGRLALVKFFHHRECGLGLFLRYPGLSDRAGRSLPATKRPGQCHARVYLWRAAYNWRVSPYVVVGVPPGGVILLARAGE